MGHSIFKGGKEDSHPGPVLTPAVPSCLPGTGLLGAAPEDSSLIHVPEVISVTLKVSSVLPPYEQTISVLAKSSLEDILKKAQELGKFT